MALSTEHQFIFGVLVMYGFFFIIFSLSNGQVYGLPTANLFDCNSLTNCTYATPTQVNATNPLISAIETTTNLIQLITSFFFIMFINPFSNYWWMLPINWAIFGTTIYLFVRIIRGGG